MRDLPTQVGFLPACERIGGGFLGLADGARARPEALADLLARIRMASGAGAGPAPGREGPGAYLGARQILGARCTPAMCSISAAVACRLPVPTKRLRRPARAKSSGIACCVPDPQMTTRPVPLQPLGEDELTAARQRIAEKLHDLAMTLPASLTLTAISRPVSRGVLPAVRRLAPGGADATGFDRSALTVAIRALADKPLAQAATMVGARRNTPPTCFPTCCSSRGSWRRRISRLQVAEAALNNLRGLFSPMIGYSPGAATHDCYLGRLRTLGRRPIRATERCGE